MTVIQEADKAIRLARAIASDISLYNEEKIKEGIRNDNLFDSLAAEFDEGRELYRTRVAPELDEQAHYFWQAIVNIVIRSKGHIRSKMW